MNAMAVYLFPGSALITVLVALLAFTAAGVSWRLNPAKPFCWGFAILGAAVSAPFGLFLRYFSNFGKPEQSSMKSLYTTLLTAAGLLCMPGAHAEQFSVLVFSKTAGWRHESINAGVTAIQELGKLHDFNVYWTEDAGSVMQAKELAKYKAVIFLLTTGDILDSAQQAAFEGYIKAGGGYVGVHSASDTQFQWPWYTRMVGHMFQTHPAIQTAVLQVEDRNFPGMDRFAKRSLVTEEWYQFGPALSSKLHYLLSVDEATYTQAPQPAGKPANGLGKFHPVSWYQEYDNGRAFYTALGHAPATYRDTTFLHHLYGGIYWAATGRTFKAGSD